MLGVSETRPRRALLALCAGALIALPLTACAPEPGTDTGGTIPESVAGAGGKDSESKPGAGDSESSWSEQDVPEDLPKSTTLPESFPSAQFAIPDGAVIDDAGSRSDTSWFVVLRAADAATADTLWAGIISANGFAEADSAETAEGGMSAQLTGEGVSALGLTIPQDDGQVLISYDIELAA
ncbi:hypothetical protein [Leucobacter chromiireducens]|uniref:hypothetical protein n=1 Tax=Leucobacter chromiireducens TaxID=283877 RepID=UPI000F630DF4|nr:hypothetical protein [Leucobacter chromiireducens]